MSRTCVRRSPAATRTPPAASYDPVSGRVVRREEIRPTETTIFTYDDCRTVAGYTTAWRWSVPDGHAEHDAEYRIEHFVARPVPTAKIDVAPPRRALVECPAGKTSIDLPVRLVLLFTRAPGSIALDVRLGNQQPLTTVVINGATAERFAVDTGGTRSAMIDDYFARRYSNALVDRGGGGAQRNMEIRGVGGQVDVRPSQLEHARLGNVTFTDFVACRVVQRTSYEGDFGGTIGPQMLRLFTVWLEYGDSRIYLIANDDGRRAMRYARSRLARGEDATAGPQFRSRSTSVRDTRAARSQAGRDRSSPSSDLESD